MGELRASIRGATVYVPGDRAFSFLCPFLTPRGGLFPSLCLGLRTNRRHGVNNRG